MNELFDKIYNRSRHFLSHVYIFCRFAAKNSYRKDMIPFEEIDQRLIAIGKDRNWLTEITPYSLNSIRQALAPAGSARSARLQKILSDAIEAEEARQGSASQIPPGYSAIFLNDEQLTRADIASRIVGAPSLADFCRDAILARANDIIHNRESRPQFQQPANVEHLPIAAESSRKYPAKARKA